MTKVQKHILSLLLILVIIIVFGTGCSTSTSNGKYTKKEMLQNISKGIFKFDDVARFGNDPDFIDSLQKAATVRSDKIHYGNATASVVFPIYFPLIIPDDFEYKSSSIKKGDFNGDSGQLIVNYVRGADIITIYEGNSYFDDSDVTEDQSIALANSELTNGFFQERKSGFIYVGWGGGGDGFANDPITYLIKAKGITKNELIAIANKMVLYE